MKNLDSTCFCAFFTIFLSLSACATGNDNLGTGGSSAGSSTSSSNSGGAGGGELPVEPNGPPKLTLVNGINDYEAIRFCFLPYPDGGDPPPIPAESAGLAFAKPLVVDPNNPAIPSGQDLWLHVIGGDLSKTAGKNCAELTSGSPPAGVIVASVAVIPASAFTAERSLLLVPHGCIGGPNHTDPIEKLACGETYSPDTPFPGLLAAGMSRLTTPNTISIQAAHAAPGMTAVDLRITPDNQGTMPYLFAAPLTLGEVGPFPPFQQLSRQKIGAVTSIQISTFSPNQAQQSSASSLADALASGGIDQAAFADGEGFTLVAVGAAPGFAAGPFWHALTWTAVRSDP